MSKEIQKFTASKGGLNCPHCGVKSISIKNKLLRWKYHCQSCGNDSRLSLWMIGLIVGMSLLGASIMIAGEQLGVMSPEPEYLIPLCIVLFAIYALLYTFVVPLRRTT